MTDHRSNRNEQRRARALQQSSGISYMQALAEVRRMSQEADGPSVELAEPIRQVPAEYRFVVSVVEDLRRHGRAGAAQSVLRRRAADFFQDRSSLGHDLGDLIRLASYGARYWGMSGLHQIEESQLAELAEPWLPLSSAEGAEMLEQVIGGWSYFGYRPAEGQSDADMGRRHAEVFLDLARRTGGCVVPFDLGAPGRLRDILAAAAVYAVGGEVMLREKQHEMPGAVLLLEHLRK